MGHWRSCLMRPVPSPSSRTTRATGAWRFSGANDPRDLDRRRRVFLTLQGGASLW